MHPAHSLRLMPSVLYALLTTVSSGELNHQSRVLERLSVDAPIQEPCVVSRTQVLYRRRPGALHVVDERLLLARHLAAESFSKNTLLRRFSCRGPGTPSGALSISDTTTPS